MVRFNEKPSVRPLAAARTGGALTVEANLFSRFARVVRATFFFYGDAAGTCPAPCIAVPDLTTRSRMPVADAAGGTTVQPPCMSRLMHASSRRRRLDRLFAQWRRVRTRCACWTRWSTKCRATSYACARPPRRCGTASRRPRCRRRRLMRPSLHDRIKHRSACRSIRLHLRPPCS